MFIFVRKSDRVIVGSSVRPVSEADMEQKGRDVYEIPDTEFTVDMIGQKLVEFCDEEDK